MDKILISFMFNDVEVCRVIDFNNLDLEHYEDIWEYLFSFDGLQVLFEVNGDKDEDGKPTAKDVTVNVYESTDSTQCYETIERVECQIVDDMFDYVFVNHPLNSDDFAVIDAYDYGCEFPRKVAVVYKTGEVCHLDCESLSSKKVQKAIADAQEEMRKKMIDARCPDGTIEVWCQIGGHIFATQKELNRLLGKYEKGQDDLMEKIVKRSFMPEGRCTIPSFVVEELDEKYELDYPDCDYEFAVHLA